MAWFLMMTMVVHGVRVCSLCSQLVAELDKRLDGEETRSVLPPLLLGLSLHGACAVWALLLLLVRE